MKVDEDGDVTITASSNMLKALLEEVKKYSAKSNLDEALLCYYT